MMVGSIVNEVPDYFVKSSTTSMVTGVQEYELPADFDKIIMVSVNPDGTWRRATLVPRVNIAGELSTANQNYTWADPHYYLLGQSVGLLPIPSETGENNLKLWYSYTPAGLSEDGSIPDLPAKFHYIIKYLPYSHFLDNDDEHVAAERMRQRFDALVGDMVDKLSDRQVDDTRSVEITTNQGLYIDSDGWV